MEKELLEGIMIRLALIMILIAAFLSTIFHFSWRCKFCNKFGSGNIFNLIFWEHSEKDCRHERIKKDIQEIKG